MMVHETNVWCHTDPKTAELTGKTDDGKWLPFVFSMEIVEAIKLSTDDEESPLYNCTTLFTVQSDTFIINTPFAEFSKKFVQYNSLIIMKSDDDVELGGDDDLEL